jgi:cell division protein FtsA
MKNEVVVIPGLPNRQSKEISVYAISQVIRARMEDIIQKVDFEIQLSRLGTKLYGGVVLTGGGSSMKEISQLFSYYTGLEVHLGSPGQHLGRGMIDEVRNPMYATGIGLVMKGIESEQNFGSEFKPNERIKAKSETVNQEPIEAVIEEEETKQVNNGKKTTWIKSPYQGLRMFGDFFQTFLSDNEHEDFKN